MLRRTLCLLGVCVFGCLVAGPTPDPYGYTGEFLNGQSSDQYRLPNPNGTYGTRQQNALEPPPECDPCDQPPEPKCPRCG